jgi:hypothetical protein
MKITKTSLILLGLLVLFSGCREDFPTYSGFCDQNGTKTLQCLHYAVLDKKDKTSLEKHFGITDDPKCPYRVELSRYHVGDCNNPVVKSVGSDFDGYVRIEIKKGFACYYKVQSDFKNDEEAALERVLVRFKKEIL